MMLVSAGCRIQVNSLMEPECIAHLLTNKVKNSGEKYQDIGFLRFSHHPDSSGILCQLSRVLA